MTPKRRRRLDIDRVLSEIEEAILRASDTEILEDAGPGTRAADEVRTLIARQIQHRNHSVPRDPASRRRLLQNLLLSRPALGASMRVSFSDGRSPSDEQVDELIEALVREGVIGQKSKD
jgi:hypothetical protein